MRDRALRHVRVMARARVALEYVSAFRQLLADVKTPQGVSRALLTAPGIPESEFDLEDEPSVLSIESALGRVRSLWIRYEAESGGMTKDDYADFVKLADGASVAVNAAIAVLAECCECCRAPRGPFDPTATLAPVKHEGPCHFTGDRP